MVTNTIGNVSFIAMLGLMFANYKYNKICLMINIFFSFICISFGVSSYERIYEDLKKTIIFAPYMVVGIVYINYMARHFPILIGLIIKKSKLNSKFK